MTVLIASLALILVGCQDNQAETSQEPIQTQTPASTPVPTPEPTPADTSYSVVDSQGNEITFESVPKTVVSLAPNVTEIIFAIGAEDKLIARTDWCNYPEAVFEYASVGNIDQPDVEAIIELNPDVVILSEITMKELALQIQDAGIPIFVVDEEDSFSGAYKCVEIVGQVLGAEDKALEITSSMKEDIESIINEISTYEKKTVYYVMGYGEYGDFTAGKGTFISQMIAAAGGINVADDTEGWAYSVEKLVEHNPDVLLLSTWAPSEGLKETAGYKDLAAVKDDRMFTLDDDSLQRLGPRIVDAFGEMAKAIHYDIYK